MILNLKRARRYCAALAEAVLKQELAVIGCKHAEGIARELAKFQTLNSLATNLDMRIITVEHDRGVDRIRAINAQIDEEISLLKTLLEDTHKWGYDTLTQKNTLIDGLRTRLRELQSMYQDNLDTLDKIDMDASILLTETDEQIIKQNCIV